MPSRRPGWPRCNRCRTGLWPLLESLAAFLSQQEAYAMHVAPATLFLTGASRKPLTWSVRYSPSLATRCSLKSLPAIWCSVSFTIITCVSWGYPPTLQDCTPRPSKPCLPIRQRRHQCCSTPFPRSRTLPGVCCRWSAGRRVQLAQQYHFTIVADEVHHLLHYGPPPPPPLVAFDHTAAGQVISLGSFSKILAPGLRLGWAQAHPP